MPFTAEKAVFANRKSFYGFIRVASTFFVYASLWILCGYRLQFEITNCILQETLDCLNKKWLQTIQVSTWASIITWRPYIWNLLDCVKYIFHTYVQQIYVELYSNEMQINYVFSFVSGKFIPCIIFDFLTWHLNVNIEMYMRCN